jgi:pyruvate/2-oxoglutarate/acetoin dehydrogenase E1 component/TPP-dependent pyruvate/acetoin dehydrogenase alpha subunit
MAKDEQAILDGKLSFEEFKKEVLEDYQLVVESRETSLLGRKEVLTGKAKFGIFGDGKELAQVAMAKSFENGDIRSGYYRDQTFMFAAGMSNIQEFFAQLYATPDTEKEPSSGGRQMNGHYATRWIDSNGEYKDLTQSKNSSADISPTAGQMVRGLGLAFASKCYRQNEELHTKNNFSVKGNEVTFCTIGDASTSEGPFWETMNAAGVLQVPLAVFVYDDGYGISVPRKYQTTKNSISKALAGFQHNDGEGGIDIYQVKGWDYAALCNVITTGIAKVRENHTPALFHIQEVTQPQGHSTSGSHERYKTAERLEWEKEADCVHQMRKFILENAIANDELLDKIDAEAKEKVKKEKQTAWNDFLEPIKQKIGEAETLMNQLVFEAGNNAPFIAGLVKDLKAIKEPIRKDIMVAVSKSLRFAPDGNAKRQLNTFYQNLKKENEELYNSYLYSTSDKAVRKIEAVAPILDTETKKNGYEILNAYFDKTLAENPNVFAFGEDVGHIGDVNQGFAGLQEKHGKTRVFDTGIRENTIIGQGIGMAMRGLRPIAEIQYLDYLLYGLQPLSDDVSTMEYRTKGGQKCPLIVRTRGHRLEGVWHSGSPMGMIINSLRGMNICVPRNMTQACGMYQTLLQSDEPALVVECLNGYRLKEQMPKNLGEYTIPLGIPEIIRQGEDVTIVSYGSTLRIIEDAIVSYLDPAGISCQVIDVQTLLPFDINNSIVEELKKTNRIVFVDEDVPGGATAFMFQQVMEKQGGYRHLDVSPRTIAARAHRPAYGTDGDYFSKPNAEDISAVIEDMMAE